jgi:hypothetical protein
VVLTDRPRELPSRGVWSSLDAGAAEQPSTPDSGSSIHLVNLIGPYADTICISDVFK